MASTYNTCLLVLPPYTFSGPKYNTLKSNKGNGIMGIIACRKEGPGIIIPKY